MPFGCDGWSCEPPPPDRPEPVLRVYSRAGEDSAAAVGVLRHPAFRSGTGGHPCLRASVLRPEWSRSPSVEPSRTFVSGSTGFARHRRNAFSKSVCTGLRPRYCCCPRGDVDGRQDARTRCGAVSDIRVTRFRSLRHQTLRVRHRRTPGPAIRTDFSPYLIPA